MEPKQVIHPITGKPILIGDIVTWEWGYLKVREFNKNPYGITLFGDTYNNREEGWEACSPFLDTLQLSELTESTNGLKPDLLYMATFKHGHFHVYDEPIVWDTFRDWKIEFIRPYLTTVQKGRDDMWFPTREQAIESLKEKIRKRLLTWDRDQARARKEYEDFLSSNPV